MLCEQCGQKPAVVHVTKVHNGQKVEMHLCQECAQQSGEFSGGFDFQNILASLFQQPHVWSSSPPTQTRKCPVCGSTVQDIQKRSQMGCSRCYQEFDKEVNTLLRRIHGTTTHSGKVPAASHGRIRLERQMDELKGKLQQAIAEEKYEQAAELRDAIRDLQRELQEG